MDSIRHRVRWSLAIDRIPHEKAPAKFFQSAMQSVGRFALLFASQSEIVHRNTPQN